MKEDQKTITVSEQFLEIYNNFNVTDKVSEMKALGRKELYLLLTLCWDVFDEGDPVVIHNFLPFKQECIEIFKLQDTGKTEVTELLELVDETGDEYIETDIIRDSYGIKLPPAKTKEEIRDAKLNLIENSKN